MATNYGARAGLGSAMDIQDKYKLNVKGDPDNIGINNEKLGYQTPYRATFLNNMPESKDEYMTELAHGMNSNDDNASNQRFQELAQREDELKKQIMDLEAEIEYQKKLRDLDMANDPMWEVAKHQFIFNGDDSALKDIMARKTQLEQTEMQKDSAKAEKTQEKLKAFRRQRTALQFALQEASRNTDSFEAKSNLFDAYQRFMDSAEDLGEKPQAELDHMAKVYDKIGDIEVFLGLKQPDVLPAVDAAEQEKVQKAMDFDPNVKHTAEENKEIQEILGVEADGIFGKQSKAALKKYKEDHANGGSAPSPSPNPARGAGSVRDDFERAKKKNDWQSMQKYFNEAKAGKLLSPQDLNNMEKDIAESKVKAEDAALMNGISREIRDYVGNEAAMRATSPEDFVNSLRSRHGQKCTFRLIYNDDGSLKDIEVKRRK